MKYESAHTCAAELPASSDVELEIGVIGPELKLIFFSAAFPHSPTTKQIAISIDGGPDVTVNALSEDNVYAVAITHDLGVALRSGASLAAVIEGKTYAFDIHHAAEVMDAASRCAEMPTFVELFKNPPMPIAGAGDWKIIDNLPNVDKCSIRRNGEQVDTMLMRNNSGRLNLFAGRADWALPTTTETVSLKFGDNDPIELKAGVFDNLIIVSLADPKLEDELTHSKQLSWHTPQGDFTASLDGVLVALDELRSCDQKKSQGR